MKHLKVALYLCAILSCTGSLTAQTEIEKGRPDLSKNEIGISFGNTSGLGNGILLSFNRYLTEKHIRHFSFSPAFAAGYTGLSGTFEFWDEKRKFI